LGEGEEKKRGLEEGGEASISKKRREGGFPSCATERGGKEKEMRPLKGKKKKVRPFRSLEEKGEEEGVSISRLLEKKERNIRRGERLLSLWQS